MIHLLQTEVHQYLETFFKANSCPIEENGAGFLTIQLTVDMDKELMNRPFYWTYLEKTGGIPNPMKVTFITDKDKAPEDLKGEVVHFGAPRLHQLFRLTQKLAAYIRLYEAPVFAGNERQIPLHPWLNVNVKISYQSDLKRDTFKSFGLNLINGALIEQFHEKTEQLQLLPKIPDYCFTISPIIKPESGLKRIEKYIIHELESEKHPWADESIKRWNEDLELLNHFYSDQEEKPETYEVELNGLKDQYEPVINVEIINGGIYYLSSVLHQ